MLEIRILISEADYDGLVDLAAPAAAKKLAERGGLLGMLAGKKERLAAWGHRFIARKGRDGVERAFEELSVKKRELLIEKANGFVREKGLDVRISGIDIRRRT